MNFARDVIDAAPAERRALVELASDGRRKEWSFGEVARRSASLAGTLGVYGVTRGDVVLTLIGNRPEWVLTMVACFRIGAVVLPCNEQLRAKDLRLRLEIARPKLIVADARNITELAAAGPDCTVLMVPDESALRAVAARLELARVPCVRVEEVDPPYAGQLMAIGCVPGRKEVVGRYLSSLPLLK